MAHTLLIVDDESAIRDVLVDFFSERGYVVTSAVSGAAALAAIREQTPTVVLLDLQLPGTLSGMDVLKAVAATVPVIVITGNVDPESGRSVLAAGAFDYVSKPFDLMYLDTAVATAVTYGRKGRRG